MRLIPLATAADFIPMTCKDCESEQGILADHVIRRYEQGEHPRCVKCGGVCYPFSMALEQPDDDNEPD